MDNLVCTECGKQDSSVKKRECGYFRELFDEEVIETICDECEHHHLDEI